MSKKFMSLIVVISLLTLLTCTAIGYFRQIPEPKEEPKIIDAGSSTKAPSDAIVLFDGKDLSQWVSLKDNGPAQWTITDGAFTVKPSTGNIKTKQEFEDFQLHIEWAAPTVVKGEGQGRGNSGVFLQGLYEVQVLDSFNNKTYVYGQAGSVYKQHAPMVNVTRKPGEWQTYDIVYHAPVFGEGDKIKKKATVTVFHNGVLIQDNAEIYGPTTHQPVFPQYSHHGKGPIMLQDHGDLVSFRNVWIRELK